MSKNKYKQKKPVVVDESLPKKVKMTFSEHKYYNDLNKPIFMAGEVYELEGAEWIQRWVKRGGVIVEGEMPMPPSEKPNPSTLVDKDSVKEEDSTKVEEKVSEGEESEETEDL